MPLACGVRGLARCPGLARSAISGAQRWRREYQQLIADAQCGPVDLVLAEAQDSGRDLEEVVRLYKLYLRVKHRGARLPRLGKHHHSWSWEGHWYPQRQHFVKIRRP
jgi:hypothetical protein